MIFFATPMYGGMCFRGFHKSAMETAIELTKLGMKLTWSTPGNESLITRARNNQVAEFLQTDHEALMFIDADIEFPVDAIAELWNAIKSEETPNVHVGVYKMKRDGSPFVAWRGGQLDFIEGETEPFECDFAGTGFMMIPRKVILDMIEFYPGTEYEEPVLSPSQRADWLKLQHLFDEDLISEEECLSKQKEINDQAMEKRIRHALFDTEIHNRVYLSEDYTFCKRFRAMGGKIIAHPTIKLIHHGTKAYG